MKITFNFNSEHRSFQLVPDDNLELFVLNEMTSLTEKGASIQLSKIINEEGEDSSFLVTLKMNGKGAYDK